jgi:FkbM family methyltransferase
MGYKYPRLGSAANRMVFGLLPAIIETELFPGIRARLDSRDSTQRTTYWQGDRFEYPTGRILTNWKTPAVSHFFDIGANYGFFSYLMLSRFNDLSVHSFEPNPSTFKLLDEIRSSNNLSRMQAHAMGLSDSAGRLFLHPGTSDSGHSTFGEHPELHDSSKEAIPVDTFDHWREEAGIKLPESPRWLAKIDVEGFELKVLLGMRSSLEAKAFAGLVVEINEFTLAFTGTKPEEVFALMDQCGYHQPDPLKSSDRNANAFFVPH